jgi:hypothetical protein
MKVDFLFLIPTTPPEFLDDQRSALQTLCFAQILKLRSSKKVWLLGESDFENDFFERLSLDAQSKEDKLFLAGQKLQSMENLPARNLVRLDDDDLINPAVFDTLAEQDFDIAYDPYHWFYDLSSGMTSSQKRAWIPNTAIHNMDMALERVKSLGGSDLSGSENYLMACDHSRAWHPFYHSKRKKLSDKNNPIYLRVLNNSSRTAKESSRDESKNEYFRYLKTFGSWNSPFPLDSSLKDQLLAIGRLGGRNLENWRFPKPSFLQRLKRKIKG